MYLIRPSDERHWVAQGAVLIFAGAVLRAGAALVPEAASVLLGLAVLGGGVRAAVLAHRAGAVASAAGWAVGVSGVGGNWEGGLSGVGGFDPEQTMS